MTRALLLVALAACARPEPLTYVVPQEVDGWVVVSFGVPGVEPAPVEQGARVVRVSAAGRAQTGTPLRSAPTRYTDSSGRVLPVLEDEGVGYDAAHAVIRDTRFVCCRTNGTIDLAGQPERTIERFYVGRGPAGEAPGGTP